jgi:single-stranded-DNA-specific exonuclease
MTLAEANESAYEALRNLAPFGQGNPKPLFKVDGARVEKYIRFGAGEEHARLILSDGTGSIGAVSFFATRAPFRDTLELISLGDRVSIIGSLERSYFRGSKEMRFRIEQLALAASL